MSKSSVLKKWRFKQSAVGIICAICDEPISKSGDKGKGALTADHIIPKSLGGTDRKENLQPAHAKCNLWRGNMLVKEFQGLQDQQAILKRAIEIIETHEDCTLTLPQRLMNALRHTWLARTLQDHPSKTNDGGME